MYYTFPKNLTATILKLKSFHKWAKSEGISDASLKRAVEEIAKGLVDADLGSGLYKKRVARQGEGKRGELIEVR